MNEMPEKVREAWEDRDGPVVLATVDKTGVPNIIYAACVAAFGKAQLIVADNYFQKTRANLVAGSKGSILFRRKDGTAYQVKGTLEYHKDGPAFEHMKSWNPARHPGHAAAVLNVEEAYTGAERIL